jgi:hypothetical protein
MREYRIVDGGELEKVDAIALEGGLLRVGQEMQLGRVVRSGLADGGDRRLRIRSVHDETEFHFGHPEIPVAQDFMRLLGFGDGLEILRLARARVGADLLGRMVIESDRRIRRARRCALAMAPRDHHLQESLEQFEWALPHDPDADSALEALRRCEMGLSLWTPTSSTIGSIRSRTDARRIMAWTPPPVDPGTPFR